MRFKEFLNEAVIKKWSVRSGSSMKSLIKLLNENCLDSLKSVANGSMIYRADKSLTGKTYAVIDSTNAVRTSRDTNNIYQLMMDTSTNLQHIPKRTNSLICSFNLDTASNYAQTNDSVFVVIPFDGTTIAYSQGIQDFIKKRCESIFNPQGYDLEDIGSTFRVIFNQLGLTKNSKQFTDAHECDVAMSKVSPEVLFMLMVTGFEWDDYVPGEVKGFSENYKKWNKESLDRTIRTQLSADGKKVFELIKKMNPNKRFSEMCNMMITPNTLNIVTRQVGSKITDSKAECWFSGKAILVNITTFDEIVREMRNIKMDVHDKL